MSETAHNYTFMYICNKYDFVATDAHTVNLQACMSPLVLKRKVNMITQYSMTL